MSTKSGSPMRISPVAYAVSVALTGSYAPAVLAQDQPKATDLDAVIVTARKREETLLDIPQEIQTISQEQLQRANLDSVKEFSRFVPSLTYNATVPGRGTIYFRGVADDSSSFIADASAAIYLDEQPLTQSALQPEIRLIDIERIEALPGPQGTLYGSSSQSGTLRYITNKPDPTGFDDGRRSGRLHRGPRRRGLRGLGRRQRAARRKSSRSASSASRRATPASSTTSWARASAAVSTTPLSWTRTSTASSTRAGARRCAGRRTKTGRSTSAPSTSRWTPTATRKTTSGAPAASTRSCASRTKAAATSGCSSPSRCRAISAGPSSRPRPATSRATSPTSRTTPTTRST